ncbi:restriction endonuclease subunit S [Pseudomonas monsensis]
MSWPMVKLGEVATINPRLPKDVDESQEVSFVSMASASADGCLLDSEVRILSETRKGFTYFEKDDVLLAKITPCFENGKCLRPGQISKKIGFGSTEFHVIRPNPDLLDNLYLFYLVWSEHFRFLGEKSMSGAAGQKRVGTDFLKNFELPLPPLPEQKRIAAILDKADAIRCKREQSIQLADDFLRAVFLDMFGDPVTNPKGFRKGAITELADVITGQAFKSDEYIGDSDAAVRLCRGTNTLTGYFDWSDTAYWPEDKLEGLEKYLISDGDVILAMDRPWISSGLKVCVFSPCERSTYLVQRVARLRPKNKIFSDYIYSCVKSDAFERHCCPTETTIPHISPVELRGFEVLIPEEPAIAHYHDVVSKVRAGMKCMQDSSVSANDVFFSLSQRAFSGRL